MRPKLVCSLISMDFIACIASVSVWLCAICSRETLATQASLKLSGHVKFSKLLSKLNSDMVPIPYGQCIIHSRLAILKFTGNWGKFQVLTKQ